MENSPRLISVREIMNEIFSKNSEGQKKQFTISFFTCNLEKNTGGQLIKINKAEHSFLSADANSKKLVGIQPINDDKYKHPITVHLPLIHQFNGLTATL